MLIIIQTRQGFSTRIMKAKEAMFATLEKETSQSTPADDSEISGIYAGLIFGRFYSRYSVIYPMPKSVFFSQFLEENSDFKL